MPVSLAADRARLGEITGRPDSAAADPLLAVFVPRVAGRALLETARLRLVRPDIRVTYNSRLPFSLGDGPLWAGRGYSFSASGGVAIERPVRGFVIRAVAAPTAIYVQNAQFPSLPTVNSHRSPYASPFHLPGEPSLDVPWRFGDRYVVRLDPGRSLLAARWPTLEVGITAGNEVWGPAIRNPLVMSANAPGIPRAYVATARPIATAAGALEAKLIAGTLTESVFFDDDGTNDYRSVSGALLQLRPRFDSTLTFGLARVVYRSHASQVLDAFAHSLDVLTTWERVRVPTDTASNGDRLQDSDQILSLFARWIFPRTGFEVYGEWAHMDLPRSVGDVFLNGHHSAAWTVGTQWAAPFRTHDRLRLQAELTSLEQSRVFADRPTVDFYSGQVAEHGWTNRGQVIGAPIGPGGSSQFIALDWIARAHQAGVFVGRIRWENDALYRQPAPNFFRHDVTVFTGARGGVRTPVSDFTAEMTFGYRYNYLFQFGGANPGGFRTVDLPNFTVSLTATPR